jgi:hypothetical protein
VSSWTAEAGIREEKLSLKIKPFGLRYGRFIIFRIFSSEEDIHVSMIRRKLSFLVSTMPEKVRRELDRCYRDGFNSVFNKVATSSNSNVAVPYFTEAPQSNDFHMLAFPLFNVLVCYAGNLGEVVRPRTNSLELVERTLQTSRDVFKYAAPDTAPLPDFGRIDLAIFDFIWKRRFQRPGQRPTLN